MDQQASSNQQHGTRAGGAQRAVDAFNARYPYNSGSAGPAGWL